MNSPWIIWVAYVSLLCFSVARGSATCDKSDLVKNFATHIKHHATIITNLPVKRISSIPNCVISETMKIFPTIVLNSEPLIRMARDKKNHPFSDFLKSNDVFQRQVFKIIFLDSRHRNTTWKLMNIVKLLKVFTRKKI